MQESKAVIISLHPEHANKILSGEKKLEFRRIWAKRPVNVVVIYATLPVQKIVALAYVKQVHIGSKNKLWELAKSIGGGLTRRALYSYFEGKKNGYAIEFDSIKVLKPAICPKKVMGKFNAPQSFTYLDQKSLKNIESFSMDNLQKFGKTIFVAGVHAVGKTSMCDAYTQKTDFVHKSAGQLIKEAKANAIEAHTKSVKDIAGNQELLIEAVDATRASGKHLLLDGHFAILNSDNIPTAIETNVFAELKIDAVVVITDDVNAITERIVKRDGVLINASDINLFQSVELQRAKQVAEELNLPFYEIKAFDQIAFEQCLSQLL